MKERSLALYQRSETREKVRRSIPNQQEQLIIQRFSESIERIKNKNKLISDLNANHQFDEAMDIRRSQIIFLMSALDYYMHQIVKYGIIEMFNGNRKKTKEYQQLMIPMNLVEQGILHVEQLTCLDEAITSVNQYKTFTSYKSIQQQLKFIALTDSKIKAIFKEVEDLTGIKNPLDEVRKIRNRIAHEDEILTDLEEVRLSSQQVNEYVDFIFNVVTLIHQEVIQSV